MADERISGRGKAAIVPSLKSFMDVRRRLGPVTVNSISFSLLLLIGWLDYVTGYEFGFFIFYFIPVSLSAWLCGRNAGVAMAFASSVCWFLSDELTHHPYPNAYFIYWEMFMRYVSFLTTALTIAKIREMLLQEERLNGELQRALEEIKNLRECLPAGDPDGGLRERVIENKE